MSSKRLHYAEEKPLGFYDTLMSLEVPHLWAALYILGLVGLTAFLLMA